MSLSISENVSTTISLGVLEVIAFLITTEQLFDISLFNELVNTMLDNIEQKKLKILLNILLSDEIDVNFISFSKSFGVIINLFIGILQVLFSKINLDDFNAKLVDWLETDNATDEDYLYSAEITKKIHQIVTNFNNKSKNSLVVNSTILLLRNIDNIDTIMIRCIFTKNHKSN
jgi:hypothetical protein